MANTSDKKDKGDPQKSTNEQKSGKESKEKKEKTNSKEEKQKKQKEQKECPICLEPISSLCRTDPCAHEFCLQCLSNWTREHNCCPVCRQVFDRILYNFGENNRFQSMIVENRESQVRRSLFGQRDALRRYLTRLGPRVDRQIEDLRRRLEARERARNRINDSISRIDAMNRQNNGQIDSTLNDIRNTINEINYEDFVANSPLFSANFGQMETNAAHGSAQEVNGLSDMVHQLIPSSDSAEFIPMTNLETQTRSGPQSPSQSQNQSTPLVMEWDVVGPNSSGRVRVSSSDDENGRVVNQRSVIISGNPGFPSQSDFEGVNPSHSIFGHFDQLFGENINTEFSEMENQMNRIFGNMVRNLSLGFSPFDDETTEPNRMIGWPLNDRSQPNGRHSNSNGFQQSSRTRSRNRGLNFGRQNGRYVRHRGNRGRDFRRH